MSYQVLARKWRPRSFTELVGQTHVVTPLTNALKQKRVHHAFLFSGTRGVGKTTIARVFAKALNCETGVTAEPCGQCSACTEIDEGRFIDLIEVDAASRTKVDDTRELLDNVPYAPSRGRYKVYLIDEVHMLSKHSFNALLKTLEEPPPHVKFLLATTDPQKLPVTVLSRCLQFNLKRLPLEAISGHLEKILKSEGIEFETAALTQIAAAAEGSVRDSLSLLDQAIAFSNGKILADDVRSMLGSISHDYVVSLLEALANADAARLLEIVGTLMEQGADANAVLAELVSSLHLIAMLQAHPQLNDDRLATRTELSAFTDRIGAEDVQLFYQIAIMARRDMPYVPDTRSGLEMTLLRMLAFKPAERGAAVVTATPAESDSSQQVLSTPQPAPVFDQAQPRSAADAMAMATASKKKSVAHVSPTSPAKSSPVPDADTAVQLTTHPQPIKVEQFKPQPVKPKPVKPGPVKPEQVKQLAPDVSVVIDTAINEWETIVESLGIEALVRELAMNSVLQSHNNSVFNITLNKSQPHLNNERLEKRLEQALQQRFGKTTKLVVALGVAVNTPAAIVKARYDKKVDKARIALENDHTVQQLKEVFGAEMQQDSIRPVE
ncbi:MAG: DNA polymerase III subunit gamma/tau [Gammaproteobacteria bacterium]|nr:DNA polymerase III subunit gamma/tau [Gammaproteobacteria bacterium]